MKRSDLKGLPFKYDFKSKHIHQIHGGDTYFKDQNNPQYKHRYEEINTIKKVSKNV